MLFSIPDLNYNENGFNITSKKASEGDENAVKLLLDNGANPYDAVYGFAYGGHVTQVNQLLKAQPDLSSAAARGYARANNADQILAMASIENTETSLILGYAESGNEAQIRSALNAPGGIKYLPTIIQGLASTGQMKLLLELIENTTYYPLALKTAAKSGLHEVVRLLLTKLSIDLDELIQSKDSLKESINPALQRPLSYVLDGYAEGRHFKDAIEIIELGINPMHGLNKLAISGSLDKSDAKMLLASCSKKNQSKLLNLMKLQFDFDEAQLEDGFEENPSCSFTNLDKKILDLAAHQISNRP